jgi:hypothetical protein
MFQVFQMFSRYVASVSYGCCKSRSRCYICCNGYTRMLQASVSNVSSVFQTYVACVFIWMLQVFYLDVVYVSYICCKYFIWMLHIFVNGFQVFCKCFGCICKCFSCFRTYVANISYECCKSGFGVVHVVMRLTCHSRLLQLHGRHACVWEADGWSAAERGRRKRRGWWQGCEQSLHEVGSNQQARGVGGPCLCVQETCNRRGRLSASHGVFSAM